MDFLASFGPNLVSLLYQGCTGLTVPRVAAKVREIARGGVEVGLLVFAPLLDQEA